MVQDPSPNCCEEGRALEQCHSAILRLGWTVVCCTTVVASLSVKGEFRLEKSQELTAESLPVFALVVTLGV